MSDKAFGMRTLPKPAGHGNGSPNAPGATVRDAALDVMRRHGMTTIFGNPGSTEIAFLTDLPSDIRFVLGLHEGSVVGMATGYALARGEPAFVNLHTAAGLGNAINAIANARDCRAPLVIVVGQQDRRQIAFEPFLTGRALDRLAGEYPVWRHMPVRGQDVPARSHAPTTRLWRQAARPCWWCRWATGSSRPTSSRSPRPGRSSARTRWTRPRSASWLICSPKRTRPRLWSGRPGDAQDEWDAVLAFAERLVARSGRSRSRGASASPRTTSCSRGTCPGSAG